MCIYCTGITEVQPQISNVVRLKCKLVSASQGQGAKELHFLDLNFFMSLDTTYSRLLIQMYCA